MFQSGTTAAVDSDSSDDEVKQPKVKSSRRRGLAARLAKKENFQPGEGEISEQSAVYSTLVAKSFRSQVQQIPAVVTIDQTNSGNYRPGRGKDWRNFYALGLKGLPGASSNRIVRPSVRPSVCLSVCP